MAKKIKPIRKFNGKNYAYWTEAKNKREAAKLAKSRRKQGYKARVVQGKNEHRIYTRR